MTLPSITGPASAVDLRAFKRRHGPRLRQEIESRAMAIAEKDGAAAEAALLNAMDGLEGEVDAIERALAETSAPAAAQCSSAAARAAAAREQLRHTAVVAGVRRRFAPHQLRHAHAVEMAREGVPLIVIQRLLGHTNLGITSIYVQGIVSAEIIDTVHARRPPVVPVGSTLRT